MRERPAYSNPGPVRAATRKEFQERHKTILEFRRQETLRKQQKAEQMRQERLRKLQEYTDEITQHGLWQSEEQVKRLLTLYNSKSEKIKALKSQVRFRKFVLQQNPEDKGLFSFSKDKRQLSVEELTANVCRLINDAGSRTAPDAEHMVVGKQIRHKFNVEGMDKWFQGRVISQVSSSVEVIMQYHEKTFFFFLKNANYKKGSAGHSRHTCICDESISYLLLR